MAKKVEIQDFTVKIRELTVRDVMESIETLSGFADPNMSPSEMLKGDNMQALMEVAERVVEFPEGKTILDLKFSDIQQLIVPVMEVNQAFFGQMAALGVIPTAGAELPELPEVS